MFIFRRFLFVALLLSLAALAGCSMFSADAWQRPSPLSGRPPPPEKQGDREKCLASGMDGYINKPTKMSDLEAALSTAVFKRAEQVGGWMP